MDPQEYPSHRYADLFPSLTEEQFNALVVEIGAHGLHDPIVLYEGAILDGRHRHRACLVVGVEPRLVDYEGDDPLGYVLARNLWVRHLTVTQKAVLALDLLPVLEAEAEERMNRGVASPDATVGKSAEHAAKRVGVSSATVERVKRIVRDEPDLLPRMRSGELTVTAAYRVVRERALERNPGFRDDAENPILGEEPDRAEATIWYLDALGVFEAALKEGMEAAESFAEDDRRSARKAHERIRDGLARLEAGWEG